MSKKFSREIKVGLMVLVSIFLFYFGINFLKGSNIFQKSNQYIGHFENLDGLVKSSQVKVKGYKVGQVSEILYDFTKNEAFTVKITVDNNIKIPKGTVMMLADDGLLGGKIIDLVYPMQANANDVYKRNDVLPTGVNGGLMAELTGDMMPKIERVVEQTDSLLLSVRKLVESPHLNTSLYAIERTTSDLAATSAQLKSMMSNQFPTVMNDVAAITSDFKETSGNLKKIDFAGTMESADYTVKNLQNFTEKLNSNESSLGLLMNDKNLYFNLNNTAESADKLLIDLKENPKRYVHFSLFGGKK